MMLTKKYKMADKVIAITSLHEKVHDYCKDYETEETADFSVTTIQEDIEFERQREQKTAELENRAPLQSKDDYLEELAVYRKIAEKMPDYHTFLFHGSVIAVDGQGYLFTAKSGTGKSTHTRLWRELLGDKAVMVNDDKPLISVTEQGVIVYGTPYNGKHRLGNNIAVPLKAVCVLTRAEENHLETITKQDAYPVLLQQAYSPLDPVAMAKTLTVVDKMTETVCL